MKTKIIAHRGASKYAPENTMPAFQLAYEMKADGIETDVQLTKDHLPVLIHDEEVKRTTNGFGSVKDYTLAELLELDAGSYFSTQFKQTRIVSLNDFLAWAADKALYLNLELKNNKINDKAMEEIVYDAVQNYKLTHRTTISSFNPNSVKRMRQLDQAIDIALLRSKKHPDLVQYARELGASSLHIKYRLFTRTLRKNAQMFQMPVRIYTVNRAFQLMKCFRKQSAGVITDIPDKAFLIRNKLQ